jgi:hypothetical protein
MMQHGRFQIKAMPFQIAEHLIRSHLAALGLQGQLPVGQVGGQTPRFRFTLLPIDEQILLVDLAFRQTAFAQPATLPTFVA